MNSITFIDTEIDPNSHRITDFGAVKTNGTPFHGTSQADFLRFIEGSLFLCGHNIFRHDLQYLGPALAEAGIRRSAIIDTLFLSPLLFPSKPYHRLLKDDKLVQEQANNPLNDSIKARDLFNDEVAAFLSLDETMKQIYVQLLGTKHEFYAFFRFIGYRGENTDTLQLINRKFHDQICANAALTKTIELQPVELAYALALINTLINEPEKNSITPSWVLKSYPAVEQVIHRLRNTPCSRGCSYCNKALDVHLGLKQHFGYHSYRSFAGEPLQEMAVRAALDNKSLLAVFPTGGGKSLAFQVPALMSGESSNGLTVIISPLQSLMKDQIDNLEKAGITRAVTINGMLDPIERAKSYERVAEGSASLLYISPESLRSRTIEHLLLGRKVVRFVIDEAHCLSAWGQDFRVDYLYIADFIRSIQQKKNLPDTIPVSCFTATAKPQVIDDICSYFREKLSLELVLFNTQARRENLQYKVYEQEDQENKYLALRRMIEAKSCPVIVYVSRTRRAYELAKRLTEDGIEAAPYHGRLDVTEKSASQDAFISGRIRVIVATSAFGMGVDKKDVGMVIHYDISDSLENYIQEAGRAGRDEGMVADCLVLYNEEDLNKHFVLLNQTKLSIKEIQQVWKTLKELTRFRANVSNSALEIARKAGWDEEIYDIETRVTTAIAALEDAGYIKRGHNSPHIYANSILSRNAQEAIEKINDSQLFNEKQKVQAIRIIRKLFSSRSRKHATEETPESRIDYISDHLGIVKHEVINIINLLREEKILADAKDLTAYIRRGENRNRSLATVESFRQLENYLSGIIEVKSKTLHLKELNEGAIANGFEKSSLSSIKTIINFWTIKNWISRKNMDHSKNHVAVISRIPPDQIREMLDTRHQLARLIVEYLYEKSSSDLSPEETRSGEVLVEFSVLELLNEYRKQQGLFRSEVSLADIEDALFYLSRIEAIKIEGGFIVIYNSLTIQRLEPDNRKKYTAEDYQSLKRFYENKTEQIHIVGEYARKMINDYRDALQFVDDYFSLNYPQFLKKYFGGMRGELQRTMTPAKFRQLFGELSNAQLNIVKDSDSKHIVVAAGPGSGKTRVLVHKLASLMLMEDVKHEQLLMLTFSRAAATEFKKRQTALVGNAAGFIEIKTFHSYCFDLLGRMGSLERSDEIIPATVEKIRAGEVEPGRITKTVLVIDEAQDMTADEFNLVKALMDHNEEMRVIAVGDDDQNIYEFRGSSSEYFAQLISDYGAVKYELPENFRSRRNLVDFTNQFVTTVRHRLKERETVARQTEEGEIKIVRYHSGSNLIVPLVEDILSTELNGTVCVLTRTNDEALQVTGLLLKSRMPAKLIQSNEGFDLFNLAEIRFFMEKLSIDGKEVITISNDAWEDAKRSLKERYRHSSCYSLCLNLLHDFETVNPRTRYLTDLKMFIQESRLEDFYDSYFREDGSSDTIDNGSRSGNRDGGTVDSRLYSGSGTILVSTMHKAKGKEFDNIFLLLENYNHSSDEAKRLLYVAMTRAKKRLTIHLNSDIFNELSADGLERHYDQKSYPPPAEISIHLTHRDVQLGYFTNWQFLISRLTSGDPLRVKDDGCLTLQGSPLLKFSRRFTERVADLRAKGYTPSSARVNFIVYWYNEEIAQEIMIILPKMTFGLESDAQIEENR